MAGTRPRRRSARPGPGPRPANRSFALARWWRRRSTLSRVGLVAAVGFVALAGVNVWLQRQPTRPDAGAVHADILAYRSGAEVTFVGTLVGEPTDSGGHERMVVRDQAGDTLELDYNTSLGQRVPVHAGGSVLVHGQLYIDPNQNGVHCLHGQTSRGCPEPGWIQYAGSTYS